MQQCFDRLCKLDNLKMTCTTCTDEVGVKVPSLKKHHIFSSKYNIQQRRYQFTFFCLLEDVTDNRDLRRINTKGFISIGLFVLLFILHNNTRLTLLAAYSYKFSFKHIIRTALYTLLPATRTLLKNAMYFKKKYVKIYPEQNFNCSVFLSPIEQFVTTYTSIS